jgi:YaiO family outer membrane protein
VYYNGRPKTYQKSIMRSARYAGLVAGAVLLQGSVVFAGEASSLRGLKPPRDDAASSAQYALTGRGPALKRADDDTLPISPRLFLSGGTFQSRRFTTADADFRFGLHQPVGQNIAALAESGVQTVHDVVPRQTSYSQFTQTLPGGWGLGFGVRQTEYNFATANLLSFSAERSFGNFRGAYTLYSSRAEGATLGSTHRFEVSYLYGERNTVGLSYTTGRDIESVALPAGLSVSDVRDWSLSGRHWLSPNWALTYDVLSQEQGPLYRRQGLRLGVSRSF